jgi:hypothetical protein
MRTFTACALLPAAALLALTGCASNLPDGSRAAVPSATAAPTGTVVSASPIVTTTTPAPYVTTTPVVTSNGTVVNVPANGTTSVVTTTTTPGPAPGTVTTYVPTQSASVTSVTTLPPRLSNGEIMTLLAGNTANGIASNGQPYYVYFSRDGRLRFREGDFNDSGSWRVTTDNQLCSAMTRTNVGVEQCYSLYRDGTNVSFERNGTRVGSFTVLSGDPLNL